jgi:hypothetical protein
LISRIHIFAPTFAGRRSGASGPSGLRDAIPGIPFSIVRLNVLRCGSIAGHADLAGSPGGYGLPIPTVAGCGGKFDLPNK